MVCLKQNTYKNLTQIINKNQKNNPVAIYHHIILYDSYKSTSSIWILSKSSHLDRRKPVSDLIDIDSFLISLTIPETTFLLFESLKIKVAGNTFV